MRTHQITNPGNTPIMRPATQESTHREPSRVPQPLANLPAGRHDCVQLVASMREMVPTHSMVVPPLISYNGGTTYKR